MAVASGSIVEHLKLHFSWNTNQDEVMCVFISREKNVLTGHESKVLIWSVDVNLETACLKEIVQLPQKGMVSCICQFSHEMALALSVDKSILIYQYTMMNGNITSPSLKHQFCFNQDEINQLDIHSKRLLISSCDDSGEVKVIDVDNKKIVQTLSNFHSNICSTVKFSARKPWELFSGGLDCTIGRWDFSRGRLLVSVSTRDVSSSESLMINPPMVHSLDVFHSHHHLVCGLGDGRLVVYSLKHPKSMDKICEVHTHLASVACVYCIERKDSSDDTVKSYVVSVGNDNMICVHKLTHKMEENRTTLTLVSKLSSIPKVNWVDVLCADVIYIFTADVTGNISIYSYSQ